MPITHLRPSVGQPFTPDPTDYLEVSSTWEEAEHWQAKAKCSEYLASWWTGQPGSVRIDPWPYTEICFILEGRVKVIEDGQPPREFGAGDAFIVHQGSAGVWETLEKSSKYFIALSGASDNEIAAVNSA